MDVPVKSTRRLLPIFDKRSAGISTRRLWFLVRCRSRREKSLSHLATLGIYSCVCRDVCDVRSALCRKQGKTPPSSRPVCFVWLRLSFIAGSVPGVRPDTRHLRLTFGTQQRTDRRRLCDHYRGSDDISILVVQSRSRRPRR